MQLISLLVLLTKWVMVLATLAGALMVSYKWKMGYPVLVMTNVFFILYFLFCNLERAMVLQNLVFLGIHLNGIRVWFFRRG